MDACPGARLLQGRWIPIGDTKVIVDTMIVVVNGFTRAKISALSVYLNMGNVSLFTSSLPRKRCVCNGFT